MEKISRKDFLKNVVYSGVLLMGDGILLSACGGQKKQPGNVANDPCTNLTGLSQADLETRTQFNYTGHTPNKDKYCGNCIHFHPPTNGSDPCGTCEIVKGPINPDGYCTQWMAKPKTVG